MAPSSLPASYASAYSLPHVGAPHATRHRQHRISPTNLPAWQYLLRLLTLTKSTDAARWADRAIELFPTCYPVALLAIDAYPPDRAAAALSDLLERVAPTLTPGEDALALPLFRKPILAATAHATPGETVVALLERACRVFPKSARLAGELGNALIRAGRADESHPHFSRAVELRLSAAVAQDEFAKDEQLPWEWQFSDHIYKAR